MKDIINGAGLFDGEQVAKDALPDFLYQSVPPGISADEAAINLTAERAWYSHPPPSWTHLARAGFSYQLQPGGLLQSAAEAFNLARLDGIHQFDFKTDATGRRWPQKRFGHSLDVAAMANLLAHHNADVLPPSERKALVVAALLHDIRMPPGGETMKHIDMPRFDEDANFPAFVESEAFWEFACIHDVDAQAVARVMREEDAVGVLKDLAHKIGYVCRDVEHLLTGRHALTGDRFDQYQRVARFLEGCPRPGVFWRSIRVQGGQAVIHNIDGFCDFLELRARLFEIGRASCRERVCQYV